MLAAYSAALRRALGDDLRGIYLYGSVALEAYLPGSSDVDVAVLHGQDLTSGQREALSSLHRNFPEADLPEADLPEADLPEADLPEAGLIDASFVPLRLVGSDGEPSL
ncbi:MAG TPA: nucleotidyltransferase domain-containing protein, partial [Chloroflexota bacterium]|nr:nucleotidyltransferase domain-containing protein [Chloroflexota bacterium]